MHDSSLTHATQHTPANTRAVTRIYTLVCRVVGNNNNTGGRISGGLDDDGFAHRDERACLKHAARMAVTRTCYAVRSEGGASLLCAQVSVSTMPPSSTPSPAPTPIALGTGDGMAADDDGEELHSGASDDSVRTVRASKEDEWWSDFVITMRDGTHTRTHA